MAYADLWNLADNDGFQHMSYVAAWVVGQDIIGDPNASSERKDWAAKVMRESLNITPRRLAFQMLRNQAVAQAGVGSTDQQMRKACLEVLDDLVAIG